MTREEIEELMEELTRQFAATRDPEIREELYELARELEKMEVKRRISQGVGFTEPAAPPLFHLLGLRGRFVKARLGVRPAMFPRLIDSGSLVVSQDNEL
jgi:hypothetical protein